MNDSDYARFMSKVKREEAPDGCWIWIGGRFPKGYGVFKLDGKTWRTHVLIYHHLNGPTNLHICHKCDYPMCVNPAHLFAGTNYDNFLDRISKGKTAKITQEQAAEIRRRVNAGELHKDVASDFGISRQNVTRIVNFQQWNHV